MYYAYVLKSDSHDYFYKGHCRDMEVRLKQHNAGLTTSNRPYRPFTVVYFERFQTEEEAIASEKYFKSAAGRKYLKQKLAVQ